MILSSCHVGVASSGCPPDGFPLGFSPDGFGLKVRDREERFIVVVAAGSRVGINLIAGSERVTYSVQVPDSWIGNGCRGDGSGSWVRFRACRL